MHNTIFQALLQQYSLRMPSRRCMPASILPKVHDLCIAFYAHIFKNVLQASTQDTLLARYEPVGQSLKECYTNMFYSFAQKNQYTLDFIACIICLLGDVIFTADLIQSDQKLQSFFQKLTREDVKLRNYLYVLYTQETLGCDVRQESADLLFAKYLIAENADHAVFRDRLKVNLQVKQFQQSLQSQTELLGVPRIKKRMKATGILKYQEEIKSIFEENSMEIEQELLSKKRLMKANMRSPTEQSYDLEKMIKRKNSRDVVKFASIERPRLRKQQSENEQNKQNRKKYEHWVSVIKDLKSVSYMSRQQVMDVLGSSITENSMIKSVAEPAVPAKKEEGMKGIGKSLHSKRKKVNCLENIKYNSILPQIHNNRCRNSPTSNLERSISKTSRGLKKQYSVFVQERRQKVLA